MIGETTDGRSTPLNSTLYSRLRLVTLLLTARKKGGFQFPEGVPEMCVVTSAEHRAGWDGTFSAPKSVSLTALVAGDDRVRKAHRESVRAALQELVTIHAGADWQCPCPGNDRKIYRRHLRARHRAAAAERYTELPREEGSPLLAAMISFKVSSL
jgi:hypothetical protein